jgi:hypothetical protein
MPGGTVTTCIRPFSWPQAPCRQNFPTTALDSQGNPGGALPVQERVLYDLVNADLARFGHLERQIFLECFSQLFHISKSTLHSRSD